MLYFYKTVYKNKDYFKFINCFYYVTFIISPLFYNCQDRIQTMFMLIYMPDDNCFSHIIRGVPNFFFLVQRFKI